MSCQNHPDVLTGLVNCARCSKEFCADCVIELEGKPYDVLCKDEALRDLKSGTAGPDLGTPGRRFAGMFIDGLVLMPVSIGLNFAFPGVGLFDNYVPRILVPALVGVAYEALMLGSGGQTLGKKAMGLKVVNADGSDLGPSQGWLRAAARQVMGVTYVLGFVDALTIYSQGARTLHDRIGKTVVINWKR
jgi:uncharacterized RDD family membrane protein YckC